MLAPGRKRSKALYFLGKSYQKLGPDYSEQAADAYQSSIRIFPAYIKPRMGLASLLPDTEQGWAQAEEIYQQVLQLKPNLSQAYYSLAVIYNNQDKVHDAVLAYGKAIEFNPSYIPARFNLGLIFLNKKKWREASDQFQSIVHIDPEHARAHFNLGRANYRLKFYDQALINYQTALDLKQGDYPEVAINIGLIFSAKKDYAKAIDIYQAALKRNQDSARLYYNLGIAYLKSEEYKQALVSFESAIKLRPDYAQAWYNIALLHSRLDEHEKAINAYTEALAIKPDYRSAQLNLAVSLTRKGELKQAEMVYRQVLEDYPRYASAWINLGLVLLDQNLFKEAEEVLTQASELETDNDRVIGLLAKALSSQGKYADAGNYYRTALEINPEKRKYRLEYIAVLKQQHDYEKALVETKKAMKLYPDNDVLKTELELINLKLNENL